MSRIFVAATGELLSQALRAGAIPATWTAHALTPALREWYTEGDTEELEYAAMTAAALDSLRLLAADPSLPPRRMVLAAEVDEAQLALAPGAPLSQVAITTDIPWRRVVSIHVDDAEAEADVAAARDAVSAADTGDDDAQFVVDGAEGHDLLWFDVSEAADLIV